MGSTRRKHRRYDDEFRASAVLMLEAAGYPETEGALTAVSKRLKMPHSTLSRWARGLNNPPPSKIVQEKKRDLIADLTELLYLHIDEAHKTVTTAEHNHIMTAVGIIVDKLQLLEGKPTEIYKHDIDDARERLNSRINGYVTRGGETSGNQRAIA